jgi:hypothetical protein
VVGERSETIEHPGENEEKKPLPWRWSFYCVRPGVNRPNGRRIRFYRKQSAI